MSPATAARAVPPPTDRDVPPSTDRGVPPPTHRAEERARILEAGYRVLAASDGAAVPVTDILAEAGLSTRAFYRHFDSRDSLLLAMFRRDGDRVLGELRAGAGRAPDAGAALRGWITDMLRLTADPRRRARALVLTSEQVTRAKGYRAERDRYHAGQDAVLAEILQRGLADGSFPLARPVADAPFIRAALHQSVEAGWAREADVDVADSIGRLTDFVFRALGRSSR